jgi:hypothetical protein
MATVGTRNDGRLRGDETLMDCDEVKSIVENALGNHQTELFARRI